MAHTHWSILVDEITTLRLIAKSSELLTTTMATYTVPCLGGGLDSCQTQYEKHKKKLE